MDPVSSTVLLGCGGVRGAEYLGTYIFTTPRDYATYTWTVPANTVYLLVYSWGSGGMPDGFINTFPGGSGGGGGYARAVIPVTPGETLYVGVGQASNNGGISQSFGGSGGGFSGVFRTTTPLIIGGGGGGGAVNSSNAGGAGGGATGEASGGGYSGGTQSTGGGYLTGSGSGAGGGYYGGFGGAGGAGGSGYINASGNLHTQYTTGSGRTPAGTSEIDYSFSTSSGGLSFAYGGSGNNSGDFTYGTGRVVIHALGTGYSPANFPTIPNPRTVIATY
jgi:hypothetical protein